MIVDVGGGIGSTSMLLASAFSSTDEGGLGLKFIIQDRLVVVEMGEKVLLYSYLSRSFVDVRTGLESEMPRTIRFSSHISRRVVNYNHLYFRKINIPSILTVHDFFTTQPVRNAAVFLLRVVLHDWPDDFARRILLQLREAATADTKLLMADFVLPLACPDDASTDGGLAGVEGADSVFAPAPLLANLGRASANGYWMDLTVGVFFFL